MDQLSSLQVQITNQLTAINGTLQAGGVPSSVASGLTTSASGLQAMLDKILLGNPLTDADQQALQKALDTSQAQLLAAQSHRDGQIVLVLIGVSIVVVAGVLLWRHHLKHKKA